MQAEVEGVAAALKMLTEAALHEADTKRRQEDAKILQALRQREVGNGGCGEAET